MNARHSTLVLLAGGQSLTAAAIRRVALARFDGLCEVGTINDAVYLAWWADWLHAADAKWWYGHIDRVLHFKGRKTSRDPLPHVWGVERVEWRGGLGGAQALCGALERKPKRILLLGYDQHGRHWHEGHYAELSPNYQEFAVDFAAIASSADRHGVEVLNCSPGSALTAFPRAELEQALR